MKKLIALITTFSILILCFSLTASAETPRFSINFNDWENIIKTTINYGDSFTGTLKVNNLDETRSISFLMEASERVPTEEYLFLPKDWVSFSETNFTLAPQESKTINFTVTPPIDTAPGTYWATLCSVMVSYYEGDIPDTESSESGIKVNLATGIKIYLTINQPTPIQEPTLTTTNTQIDTNPRKLQWFIRAYRTKR